MKISVGHIKIILENGTNCLMGNVTGTANTLSIRGTAGISNESRLVINARVEVKPEMLGRLVEEILDNVTKDRITVIIDAWKCLSPGYPNPTFRYDKVVENE